jgi:2-keto-3-deoxy-L-rhamnonate aldolase RhmA
MFLKEKIGTGYKAAGCMMRAVRNPLVAVLARQAGLDYVMFDCEHGNYDYQTLHDMFIALNVNNVAGFVRVPELSKGHVSRVLDCGATGVMIPMIDSVEQAKLAVRYSKYKPIGGRGFIMANGYNAYDSQGKSHTQIMEEQNKRIITIAQIETKNAIDHIEEIAAIEGIDAMLIGQSDLSISHDLPGDFKHPVVQEAVRKVANACKNKGKIFGLGMEFPTFTSFLPDVGIILRGTDIAFIRQGMKSIADFRDGNQGAG